jgi:predicted DNA-binding transcriptional regulator YafY
MQGSRLLSILILLQLKGRVSAAALADEFEVSVRTIYRDMDELSAAGVPVYAERGREGGFTLMEGYRTQITGLSQDEAGALMLSGAGDAARALGFGDRARDAQLKLLASLAPAMAARAETVASRFHLDTEGWFSASRDAQWLPSLAGAVWSQRMIEMTYDSWKAHVMRRLAPLGLVLKSGAWYLIARDEKAIRTYRVASLRALAVRDETFRRPARFDLAKHWAASAKAFEAQMFSSEADIAVSPLGLVWLRDTQARAAEVIETKGKPFGKKGWRRARVPAEDSAFATLRWLQLGKEVRIFGPATLKAAVKNAVADLMHHHTRA